MGSFFLMIFYFFLFAPVCLLHDPSSLIWASAAPFSAPSSYREEFFLVPEVGLPLPSLSVIIPFQDPPAIHSKYPKTPGFLGRPPPSSLSVTSFMRAEPRPRPTSTFPYANLGFDRSRARMILLAVDYCSTSANLRSTLRSHPRLFSDNFRRPQLKTSSRPPEKKCLGERGFTVLT